MSAKLPRHDGVKSHKVPAFYLRQWRDAKGQLRVRDKQNGREYGAAPEKLVLEQGFYSKRHEKFFSLMEGWFAQDWLSRWMMFSDPAVRPRLACYLAMQDRRSQRSAEVLSMSLDYIKAGNPPGPMAREIRKKDLRTLFDDYMLGFPADLHIYLKLNWTLLDFRTRPLLETGDCPVVAFQDEGVTKFFYFPIAPEWAMVISELPFFPDGYRITPKIPQVVNLYNQAIRDNANRHVVLPP